MAQQGSPEAPGLLDQINTVRELGEQVLAAAQCFSQAAQEVRKHMDPGLPPNSTVMLGYHAMQEIAGKIEHAVEDI